MVALCIGQKAKLPACGLEFGYVWGLDDFGSKKRPIVRNKWLLPQCRVDMQKYVVGFDRRCNFDMSKLFFTHVFTTF